MDGLENYLWALGLFVALHFAFRLFMKYYDKEDSWEDDEDHPGNAGMFATLALLLLTSSVGTAQKHYPLVENETVIAVGEVGTLELYHKVDQNTGKQYLIFYNWEGKERWAAVQVNKAEITDFYEVFREAIVNEFWKFGVRGSSFILHTKGISQTEVEITDEFGQTVVFKITPQKLKKLFNK